MHTSRAKTASGGAVESMQEALMEMTKLPLFFRKCCALMPTMRAWSGCATSAAAPLTYQMCSPIRQIHMYVSMATHSVRSFAIHNSVCSQNSGPVNHVRMLLRSSGIAHTGGRQAVEKACAC